MQNIREELAALEAAHAAACQQYRDRKFALEMRLPGLTFAEWINEPHDFSTLQRTGLVYLDGRCGSMNYALMPRRAYSSDYYSTSPRIIAAMRRRFADGEEPVFMRGSLGHVNNDYQALAAWEGRILTRYLRRFARPTLIYRAELEECIDALRRRLTERRAKRGKCTHKGLQLAYLDGDRRYTERHYYSGLGIDNPWARELGLTPVIMIRGRIMHIEKRADDGLWSVRLDAIKRLYKAAQTADKVAARISRVAAALH